VDYDVNKI